jgi:hypothetical protein
MVNPPLKTVEDVKKLMEEKAKKAEKKRQEQMAAGDAEPNGISLAEALKTNGKSSNSGEHQNTNGGDMNGLNESNASSTASKKKRNRSRNRKNKNKNQASAGYDGTEANDSRVSEGDVEMPQLNDSVATDAAAPTPSSSKKKNKKNKKASNDVDSTPKTHSTEKPQKDQQQTNGKSPKASKEPEANGFEEMEEEAPAKNPRKRKAAQRAAASLAVVPVSQRQDDDDPEDQDYIVESPDEDGNPKRSKIAGSSEEDDSEEEDDWSAQTLEQRIAQMLAGGAFYDDSEAEDEDDSDDSDDGPIISIHRGNEEEDETEVEYSDSDDEAGRIDIDDGSSEEKSSEESSDTAEFSDDHFDERALFESDSYDDEEIMSYDDGESRQPNSDDEIDDIVSTIRPKKDNMAMLDDLYDQGIGHSSQSDSSEGPGDDLDEFASADEADLYEDDEEDLGDFIAQEGEVDDDDDDNDEDEDEDDEDDSEDGMDIDLGEDEYTDISPMFQMTTDYRFKIEGYRTVKENGILLNLERTTAPKGRGGKFSTFKFGQIPDTHSVQVAMDAFNWMVSPIDRDQFFSHLFQRRVVYVNRKDKNYYKDLFSSDGLLRMVQENDLEYGTNINVAHYDREQGRSTHNPVGRVFAHQLKEFVRAGMSVQCINPQSYNDEIWYLCEILQELTNSFVGANT